MTELDVLSKFRTDVPEPSSSTRDAARSQMFAGAPPSHRTRSHRWHLAAAGGVVTAAVALALAIPVVTLGQHHRPASLASAVTVLHTAAAAAAAQPATSGRYWYDRANATPNGVDLETWTAPDGQISESAEGSPPSVDPTLASALNPVGSGPLTRADLAQLPTDPDQLRDLLVSHVSTPTSGVLIPHAEWVTLNVLDGASELLERTPAPPQLRAALFNVIASVPGIINDGPAADSTGRQGTTLTWVNPYPRPTRDLGNPIDISYLIDQNSGAILERTAQLETSSVTTDFISGYVNTIGTIPNSP